MQVCCFKSTWVNLHTSSFLCACLCGVCMLWRCEIKGRVNQQCQGCPCIASPSPTHQEQQQGQESVRGNAIKSVADMFACMILYPTIATIFMIIPNTSHLPPLHRCVNTSCVATTSHRTATLALVSRSTLTWASSMTLPLVSSVWTSSLSFSDLVSGLPKSHSFLVSVVLQLLKLIF